MELVFVDGWFAQKDGRSNEANPHNEEVSQASHRKWAAGWHKRYDATKHGLDLSLDDYDFWDD